MTHIEQLWLKEHSSRLLENVILLGGLQFFFQWVRDIKYTNQFYTHFDCVLFNFIDSVSNVLDIIPLIIFVSGCLVHDRWKQQGYFLRALLDGMTQRRWVRFAMICGIMSLSVSLMTQYAIKPLVRNLKTEKAQKTSFLKDSNANHLFLLDPNTVLHENGSQVHLINLSTFETIPQESYQKVIEIWKEYTQAAAAGVDNMSLDEKIYYLRHHFAPSDQKKLIASCMRDLCFMSSFFSCWFFIESDRQNLPMSAKKKSSQKNLFLRFLQGLFLYWTLKVFPLLSVSISINSVLFAYLTGWLTILYLSKNYGKLA